MNHDENSIRITRIAENVFQIQDIALGKIEIIADTNCRVNMNWKMQSAALAHQIAENVILKCPVLLFAWYTAVHKPLVDVFSFFASRLGKFRRTEVSDFTLDRAGALLVVVLARAGYEGKVVVGFCGEVAN